MVDDQLASGSLDDPPPVGGGVVRLSLAESDSLGHFWSVFGGCKDLKDGRAVVCCSSLRFCARVSRLERWAGDIAEMPKTTRKKGVWRGFCKPSFSEFGLNCLSPILSVSYVPGIIRSCIPFDNVRCHASVNGG